MALPLPLYPGIVNSVPTELTANITASQTTLPVLDLNSFPEPPCTASIGVVPAEMETVLVTSKSGSNLIVTRGFQGTAKAWDAETRIACFMTEFQLRAIHEALETLDDLKAIDIPTDPTGWPSGGNLGVSDTDVQKALETIAGLDISKKAKVAGQYTLAASGWASYSGKYRYTITESGTAQYYIAGWKPLIAWRTDNMAEITGGSNILADTNDAGTLYLTCANLPTAAIVMEVTVIQVG